MFDPNITPGPWELEELKTEVTTFYMIADDTLDNTNKEHMKAVVAIPELLKVYKETLKFIDVVNKVCFDSRVLEGRSDILDGRTKLLDAIKLLEENRA